LPELLESLVRETGIPWLRMLYLYSSGITPRLLEVMAQEPRILPYLDMPMQHASDAVLARMRRPERQRTIRDRVRTIREVVPDIAIRTTCIVGFPGETDDDFDQLLRFLEEIEFERVGAFTYSPQEGTRAAEMADDVPESVKRLAKNKLVPYSGNKLTGTFKVGSTNFGEQEIVAELYSQVIESAGGKVDRKFKLGNREVVAPALENLHWK